MQQYDPLKKLIIAWFLFLMLFIVIASSRPVNKNVSTGAVIRANQVQSWRTIKPVVTSLGLYDRLTTRSFMNSPNALKRDEQSPRRPSTQVLNSSIVDVQKSGCNRISWQQTIGLRNRYVLSNGHSPRWCRHWGCCYRCTDIGLNLEVLKHTPLRHPSLITLSAVRIFEISNRIE